MKETPDFNIAANLIFSLIFISQLTKGTQISRNRHSKCYDVDITLLRLCLWLHQIFINSIVEAVFELWGELLAKVYLECFGVAWDVSLETRTEAITWQLYRLLVIILYELHTLLHFKENLKPFKTTAFLGYEYEADQIYKTLFKHALKIQIIFPNKV